MLIKKSSQEPFQSLTKGIQNSYFDFISSWDPILGCLIGSIFIDFPKKSRLLKKLKSMIINRVLHWSTIQIHNSHKISQLFSCKKFP